VTDARLHSEKPIDDEVPFGDAGDAPRDETLEDDPAIVTPAAARRERLEPDPDVDPGERERVDLDPELRDPQLG
jgi:hypothetical protein